MVTMNFKTVLPYYYQPQDISTGILPNTPLYVPEVINNPLNDPNAWSRRLYDMVTMNFKTVLPYYYQPQDISTGILPNTPLYVPEVINNPLNDPNAWSSRLYDYFGSRNKSTSNKQTQKKSSQSKTPNYSGNFSGSIRAALQEALRITGSPQSWLPYMEWLVSKESSGNPRAVNPIPVGREHATGLLQTLPSTFKAYALPGYGNIYNPLDNAIAAIRYIKSRYGSPANIPGIFGKTWKGY